MLSDTKSNVRSLAGERGGSRHLSASPSEAPSTCGFLAVVKGQGRVDGETASNAVLREADLRAETVEEWLLAAGAQERQQVSCAYRNQRHACEAEHSTQCFGHQAVPKRNAEVGTGRR
jgi:hypothetical protein